MMLSAPIYQLKRRAKLRSRTENIPLHQALNEVARSEGFASWGLLAARHSASIPTAKIFDAFAAGDMVLLGARRGHGKTVMGLELLLETIKRGKKGAFFSLEYTADQAKAQIASLGIDLANTRDALSIDTSDEISASYIISRLADHPHDTVVIDYLQVLDQDRREPDLASQVTALQGFAQQTGSIIVLLSQIDRSYDTTTGSLPTWSDVRRSNAVQLAAFNASIFINGGVVRAERRHN